MLAEMLYEETGKATTTRVLSADASGIDIEITLQTKGKIMGVEQSSAWTYNSKTGPDGAIRGEVLRGMREPAPHALPFLCLRESRRLQVLRRMRPRPLHDGGAGFRRERAGTSENTRCGATPPHGALR